MKRLNDKVSVVIPNYNGKKLLKKCLNSILNETEYENYEIIIVDNNSSDGSAKMVKKFFPRLKLIQNKKNYGFAKGNNIGIKEGMKNNANFILLLNNDTEVTKNWLKDIVNIANEDKKIGIIGPKLILPDGSIQKNCYSFRCGLTKKFVPKKSQLVDCVSGACMLIKRNLIEKIGLLDERFTPLYFEDIDYCLRAKKAGYEIVYTTEVTVHHHKAETTKKYDWVYKAYHISRIKFMVKHFPFSWIIVRISLEIFNILKSIKIKKFKVLISAYKEALKG